MPDNREGGSKRPDVNRYLEIVCYNPQSAVAAALHGADRIEFCAGAEDGGITPSLMDLVSLRPRINPAIPIHVMIRPRGGDFVYTADELQDMQMHIIKMKNDAAGFVFGVLDAQGGVNMAANRQLLDTVARHAKGKPCIFHRAFDACLSPTEALQDIAKLGFLGVLTSGGGSTAVDGLETLRTLVPLSRDAGISLIVGGGVRSSNIAHLVEETGATWYHSSAGVNSTGVVVEGEAVATIKARLNA